MNSSSNKSLLFSVLFLTSIALVPEAPASAGTASSEPSYDSLAQEDRFAEFEQKFRQAMKINAKEEMAKLLDRYSWESVLVVMTTCEAISNQSSDYLEEFAAALNEAWKKQYAGSQFVDKVYEYFSLLDPVLKRKRVKLKNLFEATRTQMRDNEQGAKDGPKFMIIASEFERLALSFEQIGDWYYASESWISYGTCFDTGNRGKADANLFKASTGYKKALDSRDKIQLQDKRYREIEPIFKLYEKQGYFKKEPNADGTGEGGTPEPVQEDADSALILPMTFDLIEELDTFARPNYHADDVFPVWTSIPMTGKGTSIKIAGLEDSPYVHRLGVSDVRIDLAGDGPENDEKLKLNGNMVPIHFPIGSGPEAREYGLVTIIGGSTDPYQGIQANLAPSDDYCTIYIVAAGSVVGDLAGVAVRVIDDNMDGIYGSPPVQWGHMGISDDHFQSDMDSVVIGSSKRAVPWSEYQDVEGQWYKFESLNKGTQLKVTPIELETGTLKLKIKGLSADWAVVRGTGRLENCYFDLLQNGAKGVQVPVGNYELFMGRVSKGKKLQVMKALILPGATTSSWEVNPGKPTTVELGGPFGFDFQYDTDAETISISGTTVVVTGMAGERYERLWNCVPHAEVAFRKEDSKRGSKPEKMGLLQSSQDLTDKGFRAGWFPLDIILDRSKIKEGVSVQITEKKNKLFGKIESIWK